MDNLVSKISDYGLQATSRLSRQEQKEFGQYMTPPAIARAMAKRVCNGVDKKTIRILEPAAGGGILAAATLECLLQKTTKPDLIEFVLFEIDPRLSVALNWLAERMRLIGKEAGVKIKVSLRFEDFLLSSASEKQAFDIVIANPPYFKIRKNDPRSLKHAYAVYGQPNIYGLFMAACARVLLPNGKWCFITPRSWTNGAYFAQVRRHILNFLHIDAIHVFERRDEHFTDDDILQEAMITWGTVQTTTNNSIIVSSSQGVTDLSLATLVAVPMADVINSTDRVISLPSQRNSAVFNSFKSILSTYGLKVSTGPIVAFRAAHFIREEKNQASVPLLWMQHIKHMQISWPIKKKREHIIANAETAWMLIPNQNMVILRRFSPKEDQRRITAAPYIENSLPGYVIGLENHTNYIYKPGGHMSIDEVRGLAAYLNSKMVDQYFRTVAGNTQVNAGDLKAVPIPSMADIVRVGKLINSTSTLEEADFAVETCLTAIADQKQIAH